MSFLEALILGIIQGLTEFLPISSSGHLELGKAILGIHLDEDLTFTVVVHGATVLSTIVVFRKDIWQLLKGVLQFRWNDATVYTLKIIVSMIPVGIIGLFFKEEVESLFDENILLVGCMLLITGFLLLLTHFKKDNYGEITYKNSFVIGLAQAVAVLPGISRSGSTIATGLLLGVKKEDIAKFSFLMVLVPIIGANVKDAFSGDMVTTGLSAGTLVVGFISAFIAGVFACNVMITLVKSSKLIYFAIYCFIVGSAAIVVMLCQ